VVNLIKLTLTLPLSNTLLSRIGGVDVNMGF